MASLRMHASNARDMVALRRYRSSVRGGRAAVFSFLGLAVVGGGGGSGYCTKR